MAQASIIVKSLLLAFVVAALSAATTVSGQDMAPAPAPDAGSAFSVPVSAHTFVKKPTQNTSPATNTRRHRPTHVANFALVSCSLR
ncbi:hypothetical protein RJ639_023041 [Escallonia herrerae]|uniref:Uncharacterized protein n=1 Tax=Escallonia herrerae TaxID=1293975 RepID=A0AA88V018_9ASTE|nr:hypothetical protein RJ639_023041 [Escallonia herrerae]